MQYVETPIGENYPLTLAARPADRIQQLRFAEDTPVRTGISGQQFLQRVIGSDRRQGTGAGFKIELQGHINNVPVIYAGIVDANGQAGVIDGIRVTASMAE